MSKDKKWVEEIEPGIYKVHGTGHTKGVLNYNELVESVSGNIKFNAKELDTILMSLYQLELIYMGEDGLEKEFKKVKKLIKKIVKWEERV